jgi:uncharacterized protein DUF5767
MAKILRVTKKIRDSPLLDIPINFPPLQNLHLELIEIKDKLKAGLPLIPLSKPKLKPVNGENGAHSAPTPQIPQQERAETIEKREVATAPPKIKRERADDELLLELGDDEFLETEGVEKETVKSPKHSRERPEKEKKRPRPEPENEDTAEEGENTGEGEGEEEEEQEGEEEEEDEYAGLTPEEREAKEKEEYIWRFRILKKQYGKHASIPIPEWTEHSDLNMMKKSYERTIRELYLDDAVETYKTYLIGGWIVMEYVCTQFIGIDLVGFTNQQIRMMHKYDRMLIELGEKSYSRWGMNVPVEIRLIMMILFQAGIFYLAKVVYDKMGDDMAEMFRGFTGQPPRSERETSRSRGRQGRKDLRDEYRAKVEDNDEEIKDVPKRKMKGPKMKAEDIRKRSNKEES